MLSLDKGDFMADSFGTIGLLGDIHGEDHYLALVLAFLADKKVDKVCAAGDIVDGRGDVGRCCRLLMEYEVQAVAGNHDRWYLGGMMRDLFGNMVTHGLTDVEGEFIKKLPQTVEIDTQAGLGLLCHGIGEDDMFRFRPYDEGYALETNEELQELSRSRRFKFVFGGHTHVRMVRKYGRPIFINGGTLKYDQEPGFAIVDFLDLTVQFFDITKEEIGPAEKWTLAEGPRPIQV